MMRSYVETASIINEYLSTQNHERSSGAGE